MSFDPNVHMMDLKGKAYLPVSARLVWFREQKPNWAISTELLKLNLGDTPQTQFALFKATILDENGLIKATAHGSETKVDFNDFIEKAEAKATGRALAYLGYGTQFAPDLDAGPERPVDSPIERTPSSGPAPKPTMQYKNPNDIFAKKPAFGEIDLSAAQGTGSSELDEAMKYAPFKSGPDQGKPMSSIKTDKLQWLLDSPKTGERTRKYAKLVLDSRKSIPASAIPMPTDEDAPDEPLANEEPPF